ncbi:hypothetical protein BT69DRAFT_1306704 [Atractiella rhizophila]|nr:hypothetical protein BT69DRAFT_1306704 [Atractiella rhizophila]
MEEGIRMVKTGRLLVQDGEVVTGRKAAFISSHAEAMGHRCVDQAVLADSGIVFCCPFLTGGARQRGGLAEETSRREGKWRLKTWTENLGVVVVSVSTLEAEQTPFFSSREMLGGPSAPNFAETCTKEYGETVLDGVWCRMKIGVGWGLD